MQREPESRGVAGEPDGGSPGKQPQRSHRAADAADAQPARSQRWRAQAEKAAEQEATAPKESPEATVPKVLPKKAAQKVTLLNHLFGGSLNSGEESTAEFRACWCLHTAKTKPFEVCTEGSGAFMA